jgi:uroporphyrinogen-III decarboxylase
VWDFNAVAEYGLTDFDALVDHYEQHYRREQAAHPNQVYTGGYYKTLVSGAIDIFGWEMLLMAAADLPRFETMLDSIFQQSLHHYRAWAKTSVEVFISHDDMVWSQGPFIHPDFYRGAIFPRYRELWSLLKAAGKTVLFCSDANWTEFLDDIAAAGADGFIFEPMVSLDAVVERYGKTHCIVGSKVDCRTMTYGSKDEIKAEIDATLKLALDCPGFMCAIGNHLPSNVPVENALFYMDYLRKRWTRANA